MYEALVVEATQQLGGLIGRVVVDYDDIELEVGLLRKGAVDSVADGLLTIVDGDDDGGLEFELLFVEVGTTVVGGVDLGTNLLQMGRGSQFHLYLHLAIGGVDVVELFDARGTGVEFFLSIEALVDVENLSVATQEEAQGIEARMVVIGLASLHGKGMEQGGLNEPERSEIEVVADATHLIVDDGMVLALAFQDVVMVGIDHGCIGVGGHTEDALEGALTQQQLTGFGLQQGIVGIGILSNAHHRVAAGEAVDEYLMTVGETLGVFG